MGRNRQRHDDEAGAGFLRAFAAEFARGQEWTDTAAFGQAAAAPAAATDPVQRHVIKEKHDHGLFDARKQL